MAEASPKIRLDKWLWQARFFKTRSLSAKVISGGHMRVNSQKIAKPAYAVGPGDVLTFPQARDVRVIKIKAIGERRGPAPEAQALYEDLDPPKPRERDIVPPAPRYEGQGRPTKRERRQLDLKRSDLLD
ncbi:Heat shock protein 15 [Roseovarius albus]|uniref:Heat shock protein 15 n=1 Tax=Roseovarius albus TaxID=1247867 RepID=A0A1X6YK26_9RHOB|nr:RNA-binding S4 domain-containing protein [Roseovarius albus]SLN23395.1 Heat shock protein 15 [Roseovarius albus]